MADQVTVRCCIAGGGPAGMMLGLLLARAGVDVRRAGEARRLPARLPRRHHPPLDARADARARACSTTSCSCRTRRCRSCRAQVGDDASPIADFTHLPTHCKFIALMPQWDFLDFLADRGAALSGVPPADAGRGHRPDRGGRPGRRACARRRPTGPLEVRADLVVGADGRHSIVRERAGLAVRGPGRADGRALVPALAPAGRPGGHAWAASTPGASSS